MAGWALLVGGNEKRFEFGAGAVLVIGAAVVVDVDAPIPEKRLPMLEPEFAEAGLSADGGAAVDCAKLKVDLGASDAVGCENRFCV